MSEGLEVVGLPGTTTTTQDTTKVESAPAKAPEKEPEHEQSVPYERFQKANQTAKQAKDQVKDLQAQMAQLREEMSLKTSGASDAEQLQRRLERAEQRAQEMQEKAEAASAEAANTRKERWIASAAAAQNFADPSDASVFLDLSEIETEKDAERAIKRLAGQKKYLVKEGERQLPGKVMENGKAVAPKDGRPPLGIDPMKDANAIMEGLVQFASPEAQRAWRDQHQQ